MEYQRLKLCTLVAERHRWHSTANEQRSSAQAIGRNKALSHDSLFIESTSREDNSVAVYGTAPTR